MVMESGDNIESDKISSAKKICLGFQSQDRKVRKQTYIELQNFFSSENSTDQNFKDIFCHTHMYFLNGLRDKSEAVREQAIKFISYLIIELVPLNDFYLTYVFPLIVERIGTVELVEDSEEIRLQVLQLLEGIIVRYSQTPQLKPFLNDSIIILCETVKDKYPTIKEISCQTIIKLANALPMDFHMQAESLIKPVLSCFCHQRYKVRVEAIRAIGEIIMHSSFKGVDEAMVPMAEKLFDQIPLVRQTVAKEAARWMLKHRDRYSYFHKMLPLLLTGLNDEVETTRIEALELWEKVGLQFQQENEKDLKDKLDFLTELPKNYPSHLKRPNLGCRELVQRNISKIAPGISNELTNWQEDVRVRCSQLLCSIALHAEEGLTFNLQNLLPAMYSAARDDDQRVVINIIQASNIIGNFVDFNTWSKIIVPVIEDGPHYGHLTVLAGLIEGAPKQNICNFIESISELLSEDYICCSRKKKYQLELLKCSKILMTKYVHQEKDCTGYNLFKIITTLIAIKDTENSETLSPTLYDELVPTLGLTYRTELFLKYSNRLFNQVNVSPKSWTTVNEHACIFLTLLTECSEAFGDNLDIIYEVLVEVLDTETDAELRLKCFYVLSTIFDRKDVIFSRAEKVGMFLEKLILEVFVPSLVWHAGATAEALRTMSTTCLKYALIPIDKIDLFTSPQALQPLMEKLIPLLLSLMEDASYRSRQVSIECLALLKDNCVRQGVWSVDSLIKIYPEVIKRLDDPTEKVRLCALKELSTFFKDIPHEFTESNFKAHRELIIDTLLTHFDDDEEIIQNLVSDLIKVIASINKKETLEKIQVHRPVLRNQNGCDEIVKYINELSL